MEALGFAGFAGPKVLFATVHDAMLYCKSLAVTPDNAVAQNGDTHFDSINEPLLMDAGSP